MEVLHSDGSVGVAAHAGVIARAAASIRNGAPTDSQSRPQSGRSPLMGLADLAAGFIFSEPNINDCIVEADGRAPPAPDPKAPVDFDPAPSPRSRVFAFRRERNFGSLFAFSGKIQLEGSEMGKIDQAWTQAAACERHAQESGDGKLQKAFRKMRDSWIDRGNAAQFEEDVEANNERLKQERPE